MNSIQMALDAIWEKKGRSFLTMLGIIIGVASVLILVAMVSGYNADITAYYEKLGVNKVTIDVTMYDRTTSIDITDDLYDFVNADLAEWVEGVTPQTTMSGTIKYKANSVDTSTVYMGGNQFSICNNYTLDEGRDITTLDIDSRSHVCLIGSYVAETLFGYADPVGETVYYNGTPLTVIGVYYQKDGSAEESMDDMLVMPYSLNRSILQTSSITTYVVKVTQSDYMDTVMAELEYFLDDTIDTYTGTYELENGNSALSESDEETASLSMVLGGIAGIALLVGGIGIMNIMLVTVTERTREIGIKKAIGAPRSVIITQFLVESSVLSALGGIIGILFGFGASLILGKAIYDLILMPSLFITLGAFLFSIVIGIGFGLYPAVKASGLQPVEALRAE